MSTLVWVVTAVVRGWRLITGGWCWMVLEEEIDSRSLGLIMWWILKNWAETLKSRRYL